jgi:phosphodiesterase/alkaline phosphatase D-like protein
MNRDPLRLLALIWAPVAAGALAIGAFVVGIPTSGESGFFETLAQAVFLLLYVVGWVLAFRFTATGATILAVAAVAIGALATVEFPPWRGFLLMTALFVPAAALWWTWRRGRSLRARALLAAGLATLLIAGGLTADGIFDHFYGPKAPQSDLVALPMEQVEWIWSGAVATDSARVVAALAAETESEVRLHYAAGSEVTLDDPAVTGVSAAAEEAVVAFQLTGLQPDTDYAYAVEVGGVLDATRGVGKFRTAPEGAASFRFTFASCARLGSNAETYTTIADADPLFHLITGDFFYGDIAADDVGIFKRDYDRQITQPAAADLFRSVPVAYMWDDHDYGPNDADRNSPSRPAALSAYRSFVPHYPLAFADVSEGPMAQAFTIGRVRFLVADLRSQRDPKTEVDGPDKSMLGAAQKEWLKDEFRAADGEYPVIVWVSSVPWIDRSPTPGDDWGAYATERQEMADFIATEGIDGVVMLAGDAHMVAADDGTNSDFSELGDAGFPVLHAAPVDQHVSEKGGPYSEGVSLIPGQFGLVTVTDSGDSIDLRFEGLTATGERVLDYRWSEPG